MQALQQALQLLLDSGATKSNAAFVTEAHAILDEINDWDNLNMTGPAIDKVMTRMASMAAQLDALQETRLADREAERAWLGAAPASLLAHIKSNTSA